jgi:hypothetical protein
LPIFPQQILFKPSIFSFDLKCRNPSFGLATKARGCKVTSQKEGSSRAKAKALEGCGSRGSPGVTTHSREFKEVRRSVREWTLTLPRQLPFWEKESQWTPESSEGKLKAKSQWIVALLVPLESSWNVDV